MMTTASGVHAEEATTNGDGDGRRAMDGTPDMTSIHELIEEVRAEWTEVITEWTDLRADFGVHAGEAYPPSSSRGANNGNRQDRG